MNEAGKDASTKRVSLENSRNMIFGVNQAQIQIPTRPRETSKKLLGNSGTWLSSSVNWRKVISTYGVTND